MQYCTLRGLEDIRNDMYKKLIRLPMEFFTHNQVGMLMSRIINDVDQIQRSIPYVIKLIRYSLTISVLIVAAFYRDPFLAAWSMIILPLVLFLMVYLGKKLRKFGRKNQKQIADISSLIQEKFGAIQVIKAFASEEREYDDFARQNAKFRKIAMKRRFYDSLSTPSMELILGIGSALVVLYGGSQVIAGNSTPGNFFSFLAALSLILSPLEKISDANLKIQQALVGAERVFGILDSPDIQEERGGRLSVERPFSGLCFENVTFSYPGSARPALQDINLKITPAEKIAIVGPSGAGKSSLVNLIPRFYSPQQGRIILNGHDLFEYDLADLRRYIGIITQDAVLFNASIKENICYGIKECDLNKLTEACRIAYIHDFINSLPQGYDTVIGEQGKTLSGGQKQRLIIARTLLKDSEIFILDEATSALDTFSEQGVQKALTNLMQSKTSIAIAHRLSTVLSADRIIVMDKGRIIDTGSHAYLLEHCALYRQLYELEFMEQA
jgi:subfamily B ATP-binding cassette protein MsbA